MTDIIRDRFNALRDGLAARYLEREVEIDLALHAILAGEHMLTIGPPGTAKSQIIRDIAKSFGGRFFYNLMDRFTTKEDLFGPPDLKAIKEGHFRRVSNGMLQEANFAFFDEIFKTSSAAANSMLTAINERAYKDGDEWIDIPLIAAFAASNELPSDREELGAFFDRFLIRRFVTYIKEPKNFVSMLRLPETPEPLPQLSLEHLHEARAAVAAVKFPESAEKLMLDIRATLDLEGIVASDRRWRQTTKVLRASAWLKGYDQVREEDFQILQHCLWQSPQDIKTVLRIILQHANPMEEKVVDLLDSLEEIEEDVRRMVKRVQSDPSPAAKKEMTENGIEWWTKLQDIAKEVRSIRIQAERDGRDTTMIDSARSRVEQVALLVGADAMGLRNMQNFVDKQLNID